MKGLHETWQTEPVICGENPQRRSESNGPVPFHVQGGEGRRRPASTQEQGWCRWDSPGVSPWHAACTQEEGRWLAWCLPCRVRRWGRENWNGPRAGQDVVAQEFCLSRRVLYFRRKKGRKTENTALDVGRIGRAVLENQPLWQRNCFHKQRRWRRCLPKMH